MIGDEKIVDFAEYCNKCKHKDVFINESPCDECLGIPARTDSRRPEKWEKADE